MLSFSVEQIVCVGMHYFALKMLIGDRAKYIGIVIGLTFASLLITQQSAIFAGIVAWVRSA